MSIIFSYLLIIITIVNTYFLYFYEGFEPTKPESLGAFVTVGVLFIAMFFLVLYQGSNRRKVKKGFLRLSLFLTFVLFIASLFMRATEGFDMPYILWRWIQSLLYGVIFISIISESYRFYKKLQELALKQKKFL